MGTTYQTVLPLLIAGQSIAELYKIPQGLEGAVRKAAQVKS